MEATMRKIIIINMMSLDGYYTGVKNDVSVMPYDTAFELYNIERMKAASTVLLGAASYEEFSDFWSKMADDPDASPSAREFSQLYNAIEKVVVSATMTPKALTGIWKTSTRIINEDVYGKIADLQQEEGKDIVMWASRRLWSDLVAHGIVAELHLVVGNEVLGAGIPLFQDIKGVALHGIDAPQRLPNSENLLVKYEIRLPDADTP
jgi:dihydrofolate reductase